MGISDTLGISGEKSISVSLKLCKKYWELGKWFLCPTSINQVFSHHYISTILLLICDAKYTLLSLAWCTPCGVHHSQVLLPISKFYHVTHLMCVVGRSYLNSLCSIVFFLMPDRGSNVFLSITDSMDKMNRTMPLPGLWLRFVNCCCCYYHQHRHWLCIVTSTSQEEGWSANTQRLNRRGKILLHNQVSN